MTIYIAYLYYDLMNLYGESGNVKALISSIESQKVKVEVDYLSLNDEIDFDKYDFIYLGSGTEENELVVLDDLKRYKDKIINYIDNNKFILSTGNSLNLFGKTIDNKEALGIFDYNVLHLDKRIVGDYICDNEFGKVIAFQNRNSILKDNNIPLCDKEVDVNYKNFYGSYLIGPLLVRNPKINEYFVKKIIKSKNNKFKFKKFNFSLEENSRDNYLKNYYEK